MLGSLIRLLVFLGLVVGGTWAVTELLALEGGVSITLAGQEIFLTPFAAVVALAATFFALYLGLRAIGLALAFIRFLTGDETALSRLFRRGREQRGLDALARGWTALAAGDAKLAAAKAEKAQRLLDRPDLTRLLNARAAELGGDTRRARRYYRALAQEPETAFVGVKGLLGLAMSAGESDRALKLAEHAFALKPDEPEVLETLYQLQSQAFDWKGARRTLAAQKKVGLIGRDEAARRDSTLALALAEDADQARAPEEARRLAIEAAKSDPTNVEAVVAAARHLAAADRKRDASREIVEAWRVNPDPRLAATFAEIEPDESLDRRRKRFARLFEANPAHRETRFLRAELALMASDWAGARTAMEDLGEPEYSARSCAIMAAIARGEGEPEAVVRGWLARALGASRADASDSELGHAAMLPLLIGEEAPDTGRKTADAPRTDRSGDSAGDRPGPAEDKTASHTATEADADPESEPQDRPRKAEETA